jgi:hypothetical protein
MPYVKFGGSAIVTMLGYNATLDASQSLNFSQPSLDTMAEKLWQGTAHMGTAVGLLSQQDGHAYPVVVHDFVAGRAVNGTIARVVWALCIVWFILLLGATFIFFRPTFGESLNSYVAGRLLVERPTLVAGYGCGSLTDNMEMSAKFDTVGDSKVGANVGHIAPGGDGALIRDRKYT